MIRKLSAPPPRLPLAEGQIVKTEQPFALSILTDGSGVLLEMANSYYLLPTEDLVEFILKEYFNGT